MCIGVAAMDLSAGLLLFFASGSEVFQNTVYDNRSDGIYCQMDYYSPSASFNIGYNTIYDNDGRGLVCYNTASSRWLP